MIRRTAGAVALALAVGTDPVWALSQGLTGAPTGGPSLSITFVPGDSSTHVHGGAAGAALLDLGIVSAAFDSRRGPTTIVRKEIVVRLERAGGRPGVAILRAELTMEDPRSRVRINGVRLSMVPQVIDANAVVGLAVRHVIEIEVGQTEPAGELLNSILWTAEISS